MGGSERRSILTMRAVALMAAHSLAEIIVPSLWRIACSMGGREALVGDVGTSGSALQSSKYHRISVGYSEGLVAG